MQVLQPPSRMKRIRHLVGLGALVGVSACTAAEAPLAAGEEEDLTSLTARQRVLTFDGVVYVEPDASDERIASVAHEQTQSAFGALLAQEVAVQSRELQNVDARTFRKRNVVVVDPAGGEREMVEVRYAYRDNAVVPVAMARKTALSLALLGQGHRAKTDEIVELCTKNDK